MNRVAVFIDGINARCRLEECKWVEDFDVLHLGRRLAGPRSLVRIYYYAPTPNRAQLGQRGYRRQSRYLNAVQRQSGVEIRWGYMVKRDSVWEEKMIDVLLATDMLFYAAVDHYDTAILVPAVRRVRELGKKVELLVFTRARAFVGNLVKVSSMQRTARQSHFQPIFPLLAS